MTRQDFIFTLFDNGSGLSLEQIEQIEKGLIEAFPTGLITDLMNINGFTRNHAEKEALLSSYEVFFDNLADCTDMIELKRYLDKSICNTRLNTSDMQVYRLWYVTRGGID